MYIGTDDGKSSPGGPLYLLIPKERRHQWIFGRSGSINATRFN
jgi:hypothetical protein